MSEPDVHLRADRPAVKHHTFDVWACPSCGTMYADVDDTHGDGCENCLDIPEYYGEMTTVVAPHEDDRP